MGNVAAGAQGIGMHTRQIWIALEALSPLHDSKKESWQKHILKAATGSAIPFLPGHFSDWGAFRLHGLAIVPCPRLYKQEER